jgi:hypothetical protein
MHKIWYYLEQESPGHISEQSPRIAANSGESMSTKLLSFDMTGAFPTEEVCFCLSPLARSLVCSTGLLNSTLKRAKRLAFACFSLQKMLHESMRTSNIFEKNIWWSYHKHLSSSVEGIASSLTSEGAALILLELRIEGFGGENAGVLCSFE